MLLTQGILFNHRLKEFFVDDTYELIVDTTVGTATTTVSFAGLAFGKYEHYLLVVDTINPTAGNVEYYLHINGNTTNTNYYSQWLSVSGTTPNSGRINFPSASFASASATGKSLTFCNLQLANSGNIVWQTRRAVSYAATNPTIQIVYGASNFTATEITNIAVTASVANAIGVGSRIWIYRVGGGV